MVERRGEADCRERREGTSMHGVEGMRLCGRACVGVFVGLRGLRRAADAVPGFRQGDEAR